MKKLYKIISCLFLALNITSCDYSKSNTASISKANTTISSTSEDTSKKTNSENKSSSISANGSSVKPSTDSKSSQATASSSISKPSTSTIKPEDLKPYWNGLDFSTYGNTFRGALQKLINNTGNKTIGYSNNNAVLSQSDKALNGDGIIPFYHGENESITSNWNKEHVWPNSRGAGKTKLGSDPHMLRPTDSKENSSRSNYFYGNGLNDGGNTWDPASLGYEPARGEAARIIFYCATRYFNTCGTGGSSNGNAAIELSNNPRDNKDLHTMGRLDRLVEWNRKYPVTKQEIRRNEYLYKQGFGRNPFIDHPSLADYIWDSNGIRTSKFDGSWTTNPGGDSNIPDVPSQETYEYDIVTDLSKLKDPDFVSIIGTESNVFAGLKGQAKNESRPWYLDSQTVTYDSGKIRSTGELTKFEIEKNANGLYTFKTNNSYLFHYIDGTHYSIGVGKEPTNNGSIYWDCTMDVDGSVTLKGEQNVYLTFQSKYGTFSGSKSSIDAIRFVQSSR